MREAIVFRNKELIGILTEKSRQNYIFRYEDNWFKDTQKPPVSLTMPKTKQAYESDTLFPFFVNMLSEGANKELQCRHLHIDENDSFGLLLATAQWETIGAITVKPM
jgi:HipA-like protein